MSSDFIFLTIRSIAFVLLLLNRNTSGYAIRPLAIFTAGSIVSDGVCTVMIDMGMTTLHIINLYAIFELLITTFFIFPIVKLYSTIQILYKSLAVLISVCIALEMMLKGLKYNPIELLGLAIILETFVSLLCCVKLAVKSPQQDSAYPLKLWIFIGIFLYSILCLIPAISYSLDRSSDELELINAYNYISVFGGNFMRDVCVGVYAVLVFRKNNKSVGSITA